MSKHRLLSVLMLAFVFLAPSCLPFRQEQRTYVLVPEMGTPTVTQPNLTLEAVLLPGYLDRYEMVYLAKSGELVKVRKAKWAQPLGALLKDNLSVALRQRNTSDTPKGAIVLELEHFLTDESGAFQVTGFLEYRPVPVGQPAIRHAVSFTLPSLGSPNANRIVLQSKAALSRLADMMCSDELIHPADFNP
ncbi:MAG: membrane integrity-associated transporter subunit PqiC [Victivallales bacterium]|nr:membrane integrity-associated transporter subunit PqiC [Victivallales bacterium]